MTATTDNDLRELKDLINARFNELDRKIDTLDLRVNTLDQRIDTLDQKLEINIAVTNERLTSINGRLDLMQASINKIPELNEKLSTLNGRLDPMQASIGKIPELAEKVGELKNWRQIVIIAITAVISATVTWLIRNGNFKP